ncbi:MAG: hypothetical protein HKM95_09590 [Inquilinus sp.]|nr:hypothetical protein [Inquilinus sp.]
MKVGLLAPSALVGATLSPAPAVQPVAVAAHLGDAGGGSVGHRPGRDLTLVAVPVEDRSAGRPLEGGTEMLRTGQEGDRRRGLRIAPRQMANDAYRAAARSGDRGRSALALSV